MKNYQCFKLILKYIIIWIGYYSYKLCHHFRLLSIFYNFSFLFLHKLKVQNNYWLLKTNLNQKCYHRSLIRSPHKHILFNHKIQIWYIIFDIWVQFHWYQHNIISVSFSLSLYIYKLWNAREVIKNNWILVNRF